MKFKLGKNSEIIGALFVLATGALLGLLYANRNGGTLFVKTIMRND